MTGESLKSMQTILESALFDMSTISYINNCDTGKSVHDDYYANALQNLKFELIPLPPYTSDLAPCDLYFFLNSRETSRVIKATVSS